MATIFEIKERTIVETPLLLFECELVTGERQSWSTHAVRYAGQTYAPRVMRHNVFDVSASSEDGIDAVARVSISLANADSYFSQVERNIGWKGSRLTVRFLFFDLRNGEPASESAVIFRGVANPPDEITEANFRLTFASRLGMQRLMLPQVRIQKRCPWTFPSTEAQREEAIHGGARGQYSPFFRCGYSAGHSGGVGDLSGGQPYTHCDYSRASCEQRGMFSEDSAGRATRRFGGVEYLPSTILVRSYGEQAHHASAPVENEARYNDFVPLVYGTAWYQPPIVFARNDGNLTRMEALLGMGEVDAVLKIVVNGIEIPEGRAGADMTATGWYNVVSYGNRTGGFNTDYTDGSSKPLGDPYGSMAYLSVVVPNRVSDGRTLPRIEALARGLKLEQFNAAGAYVQSTYTNNPAWILLDLLRRCGWRPDEINLSSFAKAAEHCDERIPAYDLHGAAVQIPRYQCNLVVRKRRSAADLVRGVRSGSGLYITYGEGGLLELHAESSFAVQQASKRQSSNSTEKYAGGWPAYEFGDASSEFSGLLRRENGEPSVRFWSRPTADTPNRYSVEFQDEFNEYQQDSLSLVDVDDALNTGQEVSARLNALGIPNFSQAARMIRRQLNKGIAGNSYVEFETSVRGIGLKTGDLITLTYLKEGLQRAPFRIVKLAVGSNHRTLKITAQRHDDSWYADDSEASGGTRRNTNGEIGLPRPLVGKIIDEDGEQQFEITEKTSVATDGSVIVTLAAGFAVPSKPAASSAGIPLLSLTPNVYSSGGTLKGGATLYYAVSGVDGNGAESGLSFIVRAKIPETTNTARVVLQGLSFSPGTASFHVYRGTSPAKILRIASNAPVAPAYSDTGAVGLLIGPPDENYDHAKFYWRLEAVPEHPVTQSSEVRVESSLLRMLNNEHAGLVVRITKGRGAGQERTVLSNDETSLTVTPAWDPVPDSTSRFVVAESGWRTGAAGATSPIEFEVPNREGATVHVSGRSANVHGRECAYELSPLTRWMIGGGSGSGGGENDVPGQPVFSLRPTGRGTVAVEGVGFTGLTNTRSIQGATLTLHYWNELSGETPATLGAAMTPTDVVAQLSEPAQLFEGSVIQIGSEALVVDGVHEGGMTYDVARGSFGTTAQAHPAQSPVYHLERKVHVIPFVKDFFGSPASGSFGQTIYLPDARIATAEMFVTNSRGNSETRRIAFTETIDGGLRTLSGGQLSIQVEGYLAISSCAAPPLVVEEAHAVRDVFAVLRAAPTGAPVELELEQDDAPYCRLTIAPGMRSSNLVDGRDLPPLREKAQITLKVLSVGQGQDQGPGSDLTVIIRL